MFVTYYYVTCSTYSVEAHMVDEAVLQELSGYNQPEKIEEFNTIAVNYPSDTWVTIVDSFKDIYIKDGRYYRNYSQVLTFKDYGKIKSLDTYQPRYPDAIIVSSYGDDNITWTKVFTNVPVNQ